MTLSNLQVGVVSLLICSAGLMGCNWFENDEPAVANVSITAPKTNAPFETNEPEVYQADFIMSAQGKSTWTRFARKGENWRLDTFEGEVQSRSSIRAEEIYYVDHSRRLYAEVPAGKLSEPQPQFVAEMSSILLNQKDNAKFEKLSAEGSIERYRVTGERLSTPSIVTFDPSIGMVVRFEFESPDADGFVFEMLNFTANVDASIFQPPAGYRSISWENFVRLSDGVKEELTSNLRN